VLSHKLWGFSLRKKEMAITVMVASSHTTDLHKTTGSSITPDYFGDLRLAVDAFVVKHFTWPGTLRLHQDALGWNILRAPGNVILSPIFVLIRIAAYICRRAGWRCGGDWLASRRILLRTDVSRRVEIFILTDLLKVPLVSRNTALEHAVLSAPQFREMVRRCESADETVTLGRRVAGALSEYAGTRSAVSEMTTVFFTLLIGALVFQALTPGMISMAPGVADAMARTTAIADFPLGQTIGGVWYSVFAPGPGPWLVTATIVGLVMTGSILAAFAGVLADPVQSRLGIHRRRLLRLIDTLEVALVGAGDKPFVAREHYYARLLDLWDAATSLLRVFRS